MLPIKEYKNDGTNPLLPSRIEKENDKWGIYWKNANYFSHRVNGPASMELKDIPNDSRYFDDDGTFVDIENGSTVNIANYIVCGCFHRLDGPAIINSSEPSYWFLYGEEILEEKFLHIKNTFSFNKYPAWVGYLLNEGFLQKTDVEKAMTDVPGLFKEYPTEWLVSFLNVKKVLEKTFVSFYDIAELERQIASA